MAMLMEGIEVTVLRPSKKEDRFGNEVDDGLDDEQVKNVLVCPGATADMDASRPDGVTVDLTLHFPKTFEGSLEGCYIDLPAPWAGRYKVIGNPLPYIASLTPGEWNRPVEVFEAHG